MQYPSQIAAERAFGLSRGQVSHMLSRGRAYLPTIERLARATQRDVGHYMEVGSDV